MEKNGNGEVRLPRGFRFHPTDEELVVQYLKRKVSSFPLPASIIPEVDVCKSDPWDLLGDLEAKYPNGNRSNRAETSLPFIAISDDDDAICSSFSLR